MLPGGRNQPATLTRNASRTLNGGLVLCCSSAACLPVPTIVLAPTIILVGCDTGGRHPDTRPGTTRGRNVGRMVRMVGRMDASTRAGTGQSTQYFWVSAGIR